MNYTNFKLTLAKKPHRNHCPPTQTLLYKQNSYNTANMCKKANLSQHQLWTITYGFPLWIPLRVLQINCS